MGPDSKDVDGMALIIERQDGVFVDVVGRDHGQAREPFDVEGVGDAHKRIPGDQYYKTFLTQQKEP